LAKKKDGLPVGDLEAVKARLGTEVAYPTDRAPRLRKRRHWFLHRRLEHCRQGPRWKGYQSRRDVGGGGQEDLGRQLGVCDRQSIRNYLIGPPITGNVTSRRSSATTVLTATSRDFATNCSTTRYSTRYACIKRGSPWENGVGVASATIAQRSRRAPSIKPSGSLVRGPISRRTAEISGGGAK
jgi:hypothetical protein